MATVQPIVEGVVKPVVGKVVLPFAGSNYLQFNGTGQYAEHAPFTPTGVNFTLRARYTPAAADIGNLVTLWGDGVLVKDANNNLVFSYTSALVVPQSVTLNSLALVADTEYLITIESNGGGVSITVGADNASNAVVIDPAELEIQSWMGETNKSAGVIRNVVFTDSDDSSNSRNYPVATDGNIQPDTLNADGPELFVPISLDAGWTDNGDGSYSWDTSAVTYIEAGNVLEVGKYYRIKATSTAITGTAQTGFSGTGFGGDYNRRHISGSGSMDSVMLATGSNLRFFVNQTPSTGTVSNISVKETTSAEIINFDQSMVQS